MDSLSLESFLQRASCLLASRSDLEDPRSEARALLRAVAGLDLARQLAQAKLKLSAEQLERLEEALRRRLAGEPLAYICGHWGFAGLDLKVRPGVLVPRPETEDLARRAADYCLQHWRPDFRVLDIGTGSGAILVAMAHFLQAKQAELTFWASDLSWQALETASYNFERYGLAVKLRQADFWPEEDLQVDLIVSNPPYIPRAEVATLMPEVRDYEDHLALDGGLDGLDPYRRLALEAEGHLRPGGAILVEHGKGQREELVKIFASWQNKGYILEGYDDDAGHDRVFAVWLKDNNGLK